MLVSVDNKNKNLNYPTLKKSALLVGTGIVYQYKKDFQKGKEKITEGLEELKQLLVGDSKIDKENLLNYLLSNVNYQQEYDLNIHQTEKENSLLKQNNISFLIYDYSNKIRMDNSIKDQAILLNFTTELMSFISECIEYGFFLSKNIFIRKEIFIQNSANINYLHQKYETEIEVYNKLDNIILLAEKEVIKYSNLIKFCSELNDIQNKLSKVINFINPSHYTIQEEENTYNLLFKKFGEITNKFANNLISNKLESKPEYFSELNKLCQKFRDIDFIFSSKSYEKKYLDYIPKRKQEVCSFFLNTIIKWTFLDIKDLTQRFLKKPFLSFEQFKYE